MKYILSKFEINSSYPNHEEVTKSMKYLKNTFRTMQSKLPTYWAIYLVNLELKLRKLDEKISLDKSTGLFKITLSGGTSISPENREYRYITEVSNLV